MIRPPNEEFSGFLSAQEPAVAELVLAVRAMVLEAAPEATELLYDAYAGAAAGYTFTGKPADFFIHIAAYATWVNLGFNNGAELTDPGRILRGEGIKIRYIRISSLGDSERPAVRRFVMEAVVRAKKADAEKAAIPVERAGKGKRRRPR
jgi:hypothetical protein